MGAGSPEDPVGLDPFRNIVNVSWPGRYIAFRWSIGAQLTAAMVECFSPETDPGVFDWFHFLTQWQWTLAVLANIPNADIFETRNSGKDWFQSGSTVYGLTGAPANPAPIGVADWTYIGTVQPGGTPSPPNRQELIPNGSITDIPIPDGVGPGHPTDRFFDATNLITEVDRVRYTGAISRCLPWPVSEGAPGLGHFAERRELATGASRAADLDGQFDCSTVEANPDAKRYVAHGFHAISGLDFWFLLKRAPPAAP